jgi:ribosomal protein S27AE
VVSKYSYVNMKLSPSSKAVIDEIRSDTLWRRVKVKDIVGLAWPRCPKCGGAVAAQFGTSKLICVRCRTEYVLTPA